MKIIRRGTFETNSSSTHSYTMREESCDEKLVNSINILEFTGGDYGWEFEIYEGAYDKLNYVLQYIYCRYNLDEVKRFRDYICDHYDVSFEINDECLARGYVDHQSLDMLPLSEKQLSEDDMKLLCCLVFNDANTIVTDNDNH